MENSYIAGVNMAVVLGRMEMGGQTGGILEEQLQIIPRTHNGDMWVL